MRRFGELLSDALALTRDGLSEIVAIVALGALPSVGITTAIMAATGAISDAALRSSVEAGDLSAVAALSVGALLSKAIGTLTTAALIGALASREAGQPLGPRQAYGFAIEWLVPFALAALRVFLWVLGGLLLFVIPGLVLAARYCLVPFAVLLEGRQGSAALERSRQFVSAHPGKVLGNIFGSALIIAAVGGLFSVALAIATGLASALGGPPSFIEKQLMSLVGELAAGTIGAWAVAFTVLLYRDLASLHPLEGEPRSQES